MGSMPLSTDPTVSDDTGPSLECVLHSTRGVATESTTQLSFKSRARNQILRLHRELIDERERHERVVRELREQNKEDIVSLSSRVEYFEAQWSRLQRRMSELWLEVEGLKLSGHTNTPKSDASAQTFNCSTTTSSTQTREVSSSNRGTQTRDHGHANLGVKYENELKRWRRAFSHLSGTPEQIASDIRLTDKELNKELSEWRTAFKLIPGTIAQKAANSKEALDEVNEWRTSFKHVAGTPAQRAESSKSFLRRFELERYKVRRLEQRNLSLSTEMDRDISEPEKSLRVLEEYQGTSSPQNETKRLSSTTVPGSLRLGSDIDNHPRSPKSVQLPRRKREVSELDYQQEEPLPASQRRRLRYKDGGPSRRERKGMTMVQRAPPQDQFGYQGSPVSPPMLSIPPQERPWAQVYPSAYGGGQAPLYPWAHGGGRAPLYPQPRPPYQEDKPQTTQWDPYWW